MQERMIAGVVLAAGLGRRFGGGKLLHPFRGKPMIEHCLDASVASGLASITIIVTNEMNRALQAYVKDRRVRLHVNEHPERGQMSSLKIGLEDIPSSCDAAMVLLGDMPLVTVEMIERLSSEFQHSGGIVVPTHCGRRGHPRVLPRRVFPHFLALADDAKGAGTIERLRAEVSYVEFEDDRCLVDVDTPADLDTERL